MKIAFVLSPSCIVSGPYSGVVVQADQWAKGLRESGHIVVYPNVSSATDWADFDVVHIFQFGVWMSDFVFSIRTKVRKLVVSPIIDPPKPYGSLASLISTIPFEKFKIVQRQRLLKLVGNECDAVLSRSLHEEKSLQALGITCNKLATVKIAISKEWDISDEQVKAGPRNGAILHVSHLCQQRKNVRSLIEVAINENLELRLAGSISDEGFRSWLKDILIEHPNIIYLGQVTDETMMKEMLTCSVFCLPSLYEGVGMVALDAGLCGANLVVTDRGGTPEYVGEHGVVINPLDIDLLANSLKEALAMPVPNLLLRQAIIENYLPQKSVSILVRVYSKL